MRSRSCAIRQFLPEVLSKLANEARRGGKVVHPTIWGDFEMPDGIGIYGGMAPMRPWRRMPQGPWPKASAKG